MPYVSPEKRVRLDADLLGSKTAGELGYVLAKVLDAYIYRNGDEWRFQDLCDAIGALESIKLETYRRVAVPYENLQIETSGDCYRDRVDTLTDRDIVAARAYHRNKLAQREGR